MKLTSNQFYRIKTRHDLMFAMMVDILTRRGNSLLTAYHLAKDLTSGKRKYLS